ncbi:hypothetical protein IMZ08_17120 [Bacillus luteolus]|uniref:DUF4179 domain-containing protein n=1 Tax=Litchfieldia luteola TaxID=682179 RepID=A0ABR9QMM5_9BACI|nr:hypothetical protein [Cytobacillus luteolus]MBE4909757.1 hypothetical protein [Cytobacillus luteolus]MBP1942701.1 hypothetical protein [Cytobacillus luteolus]
MSNEIKRQLDKIEIPQELHQRVKVGVEHAKSEAKANKRGMFKNRKILSASIAAILLFSATFFHTEVLAAVKKALQFVPGIGLVQEDDVPMERYILQNPVTMNVGNGIVVVNGLMVDEKMTIVEVEAKRIPSKQTLSIINRDGHEIKLSDASTITSSGEWKATYWHDGPINISEEIQLVLGGNKKIVIPITLEKAKTYESLNDLGEVSSVRGVEIIAIPQRVEDKVRVSFVSQHPKDFRIDQYGIHQMYAREEKSLSVSDNKGREYAVEQVSGFLDPSEFYFTLEKDDVERYVVEIPEIYVSYSDEKQVRLDIPEDEATLDVHFTLSEFPVRLTKIKRIEDNKVRLYVDVNFTEQTNKLLHNFRIMELSHMAKMNEDSGEVLYFEFAIEPPKNKVKLTFGEPQVLIKGPWTFELPVGKYKLAE